MDERDIDRIASRVVQKMMESVLLNDADPTKALAKAQADVTKSIENYNKTNGF